MIEALKLKAKDAEDMSVISAFLQDAIVPLCDLIYQPEENRFIMVAQRLCREDNGGELQRTCAALNVAGVEGVQTRNLDLRQHGLMLDLLAVNLGEDSLTLIFAGDASIRLNLGEWVAWLEDFGEPWPAACNPCHDDKAG